MQCFVFSELSSFFEVELILIFENLVNKELQ